MENLIFLILNAIFCVALIILSFFVDGKNKSNNVNPLVNLILFYAALFGMMALTLGFCFWAPAQLSKLAGRLTFMLIGWYSVATCKYIILFPNEGKKRLVLNILQWFFNLLALYIMFKPNGLNNITVTRDNTFQIASGLIFSGKLGRQFPATWFPVYMIFYIAVLPIFSTLILFVRAENTKNQLERQRLYLVAFGVFCSLLLFAFMAYSSRYQTMLTSLVSLGFLMEGLFFIQAAAKDEIWDKRMVIKAGLKFLLNYLLPACLGGLAFALLWPIFSFSPLVFIILFTLAVFLIIALWGIGARVIGKREILRDKRYAADFEKEITGLNFDDEPADVAQKVENIFKKYVDSSTVKILVDAGNGYLEQIFTEATDKLTLPIDDPAFDSLFNLKRQIIFRQFVEEDYSISAVRPALKRILEVSASEAFIILTEGRHIISIIFLGVKNSGNVYNAYDYSVFNKHYSNLFVVGYYMKNILNEAVVGTVNREIRMSGQIITSIQENMDIINNPKIDLGYRMVPAHNIGGEFVDLIRLTATRHIFIIGAMSGKGIAASMNMVIMKSIIRTFLAETSDFKMLVEKVNSFIRNNLPKGSFFAGTFGLLDFTSDTMYYINCGSPAIFLYTSAYNNVIEVQGEGHILGFVEDISKYIKVKKVKLAAGDIAIACTDGLIDTKSLRGEEFGKNRVQAALTDNAMYSADKMAQFTYESLVNFTSKTLENDITLLVFKYLGGGK